MLVSIVILLIFVAVPFVGVQVSNAVAELPKDIDGKYKQRRNSSHIVVTGTVTVDGLEVFLKNLLHKSRLNYLPSKVIILAPDEPTDDMKRRILKQFDMNVIYLRGSALTIEDLKRTKIHEANGVFLFAHTYTSDPWEEDRETTFRILSIRSVAKNVPIYAQILRPENVKEVEEMGPNIIPISVNGIKFKMISRATVVPGIPALIYNLLTNSTYEDAAEKLDLDENEDLSLYSRGQSFELYAIEFPPILYGIEYEAAAQSFYENFGVLLVAIQMKRELKIAPMGHIIAKGEIGHIIAEDLQGIKNIENMKFHSTIRSSLQTPRTSIQEKGKKEEEDTHDTSTSSSSPKSSSSGSDDEKNDKHQKTRSLKGHIIVACDGKDYLDIIRSLREANQHKPIVILTEQKIPHKILHELRHFSPVYHVKGSHLEKDDFARAGAEGAELVLLMTGEKSHYETNIEKWENLMDRDTILSYKLLSRYYHNILPLVELRREENFRYLTGPFEVNRSEEEPAPESKAKAHPLDDPYFSTSQLLSPAFAAGLTFSPGVMNSLMAQTYYNPSGLNVIDEFVTFTRNPKSSNLWLIKCPPECAGKTFKATLNFFLDRKLIPIGLYRPTSMSVELAKHMKEEHDMDIEAHGDQPLAPFARLKNERMVITCPAAETTVGKRHSKSKLAGTLEMDSSSEDLQDCIYVLGTEHAVRPFLKDR